MKKLFLIGALLSVLCSCESENLQKSDVHESENSQKNEVHEGHECVDLGLPSGVKWATCNVGAINPEDWGDYFAWGEIKTKSEYTEDNCIATGKSWGDIGGDPSRDAATANWGGSWRMPTSSELQELIDNCTLTWITRSGHQGYKVTGPNGNSIFLPAAGYVYDSEFDVVDKYGYYWSSTLGEDEEYPDSALALHIMDSSIWPSIIGPFGFECGRSVRPVLAE